MLRFSVQVSAYISAVPSPMSNMVCILLLSFFPSLIGYFVFSIWSHCLFYRNKLLKIKHWQHHTVCFEVFHGLFYPSNKRLNISEKHYRWKECIVHICGSRTIPVESVDIISSFLSPPLYTSLLFSLAKNLYIYVIPTFCLIVYLDMERERETA